MADVLLRAGVLLCTVALGYALKRAGLFGQTDYRIVSRIVLNVTLPAAVITSFSTATRDPSLFIIVPMGLGCCLAAFFLAMVYSRRMSREDRVFYMLNVPGYNIGCATLPFAQGFLGPTGVVATCMFDIGNAVMVSGGAYALTAAVTGKRSEPMARMVVKRLLSSALFDTYFIAFLLMVFQIRLPGPIVQFAQNAGAANTFLAMFMIGLMMEFPKTGDQLSRALHTLALRYGVAVVLALAAWFLLPMGVEVRRAIVLAVFSSISTLSPVFTDRLGGNAALAGMTNSVSIPISLLIMTGLLIVFGV